MDGLSAEYVKQLTEIVDAYAKGKEKMRASAAQRAARSSQLTMPLAEYVGEYKSDYLGTIKVTAKDNGLFVKMGNIEVVPTPFTQKETVRVEMIPGSGEVLKFNVVDGKVVSLTYSDLVFTKH
jgi:hypothetical protein